MPEPLLTRYLQPLLAGRRAECFDLINQALAEGQTAEQLLCDVLWPAMVQVERLFRDDRIDAVHDNMASRINRTVADQLQAHLSRRPPNGKRVVLACANEPREELGAQMIADLLQAEGWDVYFVGGGVPHDEILVLIGRLTPHLLLIFGTQPQNVPHVRRLIETIREIGVCPEMNVLISGGVFNRADGLWREVGADEFAPTARDVLCIANRLGPRAPNPPRLGIVKKRRRRRKVPATLSNA